MSRFKVGDRVRVNRPSGPFHGELATVRKVPGLRGEDSTSIRIDSATYSTSDTGHSLNNKFLVIAEETKADRPDVKVREVYQLEQPARSTSGGWRTCVLYLEGGGTATDFKTLAEAESAMVEMASGIRRRIVKRTVVTAEKVEVVRDDF